MSNAPTGIISTPTIYGKVDSGPTYGAVIRPLNQKRVVTASGDVTVLPYDMILIIRMTVAAAFNLILPDLNLWMKQPYGLFDLTVKNANVGFDMTMLPFGSQKINGGANAIVAGSNTGFTVLTPLNDMSGWETI